MPRLDGFGLLKALRARPLISATPVIFLSARAGEEARIEGFDVGADDYLIKPFSARELITRIDTHIRLSRLRRAASEQVKVSEERLRIAVDEAGMGTWDLDLRTQELRWSRSSFTLLGLVPDESNLARNEMWRSRVHPADLAIRRCGTLTVAQHPVTLFARISDHSRRYRRSALAEGLGPIFVR